MNKWLVFLQALKNRWGHLTFAFAVTAVITTCIGPWSENPNTSWWEWLEPIVGMTTLAVAVLVWLGESMQDQENSLPKRLTVRFLFNEKEVMRCDQAYLANEGDIRAWGQQLGKQMNNQKQLKLAPTILQQPGKIVRLQTGDLVKLYEVTFRLTETKEDTAWREGHLIIWQYNSDTGEFSKQENGNAT